MSRGQRIRVRDYLEGDRPRDHARVSFPCFVLCGRCGYLERESTRDPFRGLERPGGLAIHHPCPHCGARAWHDLGQIDTALAVRDSETFERRYNDELAQRRARAWSLGLGAALALPLAWGLSATIGLALAVGAGALALLSASRLGYAALEPRVRAVVRGRETSRAFTRWRMPLVGARGGGERITSGALAAARAGELLRAPLSGRPCVGYELRVLHDYAADDDPRTAACVLREQRCVDATLAGVAVPGDAIALDLRPETISGDALTLDDDDISVLLRKRGLFVGDGPYLLQEAIAVPGGHYELRGAAGGYTLRAAPAALAPAPSLAA
ncbi:MAG: hypothetical protein KC468_11235 [Myxococcales bacterium]|nr:hypothetical protein [Myxococcales bacterium]